MDLIPREQVEFGRSALGLSRALRLLSLYKVDSISANTDHLIVKTNLDKIDYKDLDSLKSMGWKKLSIGILMIPLRDFD